MTIYQARYKCGNYIIHNCMQFARPCQESDSGILKNIQKKSTRAIQELRSSSYKKRFKKLNLFTLSCCKFIGDLILMYRILRGEFRLDIFHFLFPSEHDNSEDVADEYKAKNIHNTRD